MAPWILSSKWTRDPITNAPLFYKIEETISRTVYGSLFLPPSAFAERFSQMYDRFTDTGIWSHWIDDEVRQFKRSTELQRRNLSFVEIGVVGWILEWGFALGGVVLLLENVFFYRKFLTQRIVRFWRIVSVTYFMDDA
ncbi:conserved hypothetical protein [Culex quinquefasciatus]|uniref:Uncharacterized protein n=1 Tax=Culex quinquefasciatus TaxID=7176 RepID=B0WIG2_CULQU|nr:conserved hypothetical protein [Culex quinquefasciatus]|eukprot:XP_001848496.1 conserved hypothetical protein [Culex quinquefasciatus]